MGENAFQRLRMEGSQPGAVAAARRHNNHGTTPVAISAPKHGGQFRGNLVESQWQKIGELNKSNGSLTCEGSTDGAADDRRFAQRRVLHAFWKFLAQPTRE